MCSSFTWGTVSVHYLLGLPHMIQWCYHTMAYPRIGHGAGVGGILWPHQRSCGNRMPLRSAMRTAT